MAAIPSPVFAADGLRESPVEFDGEVGLDTWWIAEVETTDSPVYGEAGAAVSPWGRSSGNLPSSEWVKRWIEDLGPLADPSFTPYSSDYPLADPVPAFMSWGITRELWEAGRESYPSVEWAGTLNEDLSAAAAALLGSTVSKEIVEALRGPLGFLGRRLVVSFITEAEEGEEEVETILRIPLLDPTTTPMRRSIRRLLPVDDQRSEAALDRPAVDDATQTALYGLVLRIAVWLDTPITSFDVVFEDIEDRPYVPVLGTVSTNSPVYNGLWRPDGIVGPVVSSLMPFRPDPRIAALPQNWNVNNRAEFVATLLPFLNEVETAAVENFRSLEGAMEYQGIDGTLVRDAKDYFESTGGTLLGMTTEIGELLFKDLLDALREARDGLPSEVDLYSRKNATWAYAAVPMAPLLSLLLGVNAILKAVENTSEEVIDALRAALDQLIDGIEAATSDGVAYNDALAIVMMSFATAFEQLRATRVLWSTVGGLGLLSEHTEEKMLMGLGAEDFSALQMGLFGTWFEGYLDGRLADLADLWSGSGFETVDPDAFQRVLAETRSSFDRIVPVWMIEADRNAWPFVGYQALTWHDYQKPVDGHDVAAWVELSSPLVQLVLAIDTASALLEAGIQAESAVCSFSGLATGRDSMAQMTLAGFAAVDMGTIDKVLTGVSISRFAATMWRQAMVDRLLLDLDARGFDMPAVYEIVRWMRSGTRRANLDTLLGPLDTERGVRRYEDGLLGKLGGFDGENWQLHGALDEAWSGLTAEQREAWVEAFPTLVDRDSMQSLVDAIHAAQGTADTPDEPSVVEDLDIELFGSRGRVMTEPELDLWETERVVELEGVFFVVDDLLGLDEVLVGPAVEVVTAETWVWSTTATSRSWRTP